MTPRTPPGDAPRNAEDVLAEGIEECYQRGLDGPEAAPFLTHWLAARGFEVRAAQPVSPAAAAFVFNPQTGRGSATGGNIGGHSHLWFCQCSDPAMPRHICPAATPAVPDAAREPLREAAQATVDRWDAYVEAHAGRGHKGLHEPDPLLDGDCGPCAGGQYGTEVEMGEYVIPALRAALAATPEPAAEGLDVERLARAMSEAWPADEQLVDDSEVWHRFAPLVAAEYLRAALGEGGQT